MHVIVTGANGQLGSDVVEAFQNDGHDVLRLTHDVLDIADKDAVFTLMNESRPDLVVNTAAFHNVEQCEEDPHTSFAVNAIGARNLALAAKELRYGLCHISTDYVFDGAKQAPYVESDTPRPLNVYGNSKLAGEHFVSTIAPTHWIVRVSAIYGLAPCRAKGGLNFVQLMLKLARERGEVAVVDDEFVSPTYTKDVAAQLVELTRTTNHGLFHCTSRDQCSWYDFAQEIFGLTGTHVTCNRAKPGQFPMKTPRPKYSVLENKALHGLGLDRMPHWRDALKRYLADFEAACPSEEE